MNCKGGKQVSALELEVEQLWFTSSANLSFYFCTDIDRPVKVRTLQFFCIDIILEVKEKSRAKLNLEYFFVQMSSKY